MAPSPAVRITVYIAAVFIFGGCMAMIIVNDVSRGAQATAFDHVMTAVVGVILIFGMWLCIMSTCDECKVRVFSHEYKPQVDMDEVGAGAINMPIHMNGA